jgi:hypothetical protein
MESNHRPWGYEGLKGLQTLPIQTTITNKNAKKREMF